MVSENNYTHSSSLASKTETEAGKGASAYSALVKGMKYSFGHPAAVPFDIVSRSGCAAPDHKAHRLSCLALLEKLSCLLVQ